jgi:dihydroorotate dehydrogenase electron transfer subunit
MSPSDATSRRRGTFLAEVAANERLCDEHYLLGLRVPSFPATQPGQFVQVQCCRPDRQPSPRAVDWPADRPPRLAQADLRRSEALLRRPFSLAGRRDRSGGAELEILYRVVGSGTAWLESLSPGDAVSVLGPLGNAFPIRDEKPAAALIGGGVGIPPLIYLGEALARRRKLTVAFCGARNANLLPLRLRQPPPPSPAQPAPCVEEFAANGIDWLGAAGPPSDQLVVYACGPEPMMRAVGEACIARDIDCQLALERHMGCGMGTCQSCVFRMRSENERGWEYKLVCADGPVFDARDIVWE